MCNECFSDNKIKTTTTFTVDYNNCIIIVKNVPCLECPVCGEVMFTDEVSGKLEKVIESAQKIVQDISIIDYSKVA